MSELHHPSPQGEPSAEDHGTADTNVLADRLGELARRLEAEDDTSAMLDALVASALQVIPGVEHASLTMVLNRREVRSEHPSSHLPERVDTIQNELGEGPCLDAIYEQQTVRVPDMAHEQRWPAFAARAHAAGAGSMLSFQLYVQGDNLGSLNLYNHAADGFDDESEQVGLLFASHAAVAYADAKKIDGLAQAIASRDLIGQAKGILMERYHRRQPGLRGPHPSQSVHPPPPARRRRRAGQHSTAGRPRHGTRLRRVTPLLHDHDDDHDEADWRVGDPTPAGGAAHWTDALLRDHSALAAAGLTARARHQGCRVVTSIEGALTAAISGRRGVEAADRLCAACVVLLSVDAAAISLVFDGVNTGTLGASSRLAREYDELQFTSGEGPCLESVSTRAPVLATDLAGDVGAGRWPAYGPALLASDIASVFAMPVLVAGEYVGALDLYRQHSAALVGDDLAGAVVAAVLAGMPLLDLLGGDLQAAVTNPGSPAWAELNKITRDEVSQATGMLVAQLEIEPAEALVRLRAHAFATDRSATDVARDIIARRLRLPR